MNKYVIVAPRRTGKTTLVNRLIECTSKNVRGFQTARLMNVQDENGLHPLYIFPAGKNIVVDNKHCLGYCGKGVHKVNNDVFNSLGVKLISSDNKDDLIVMDEVGFMEMEATQFKKKIFDVLESKNPVLIMLKDKPGISFLDEIKNRKDIELINMTIENRDEVFELIKDRLK